jgi:hypothetical protein
MAALAVAWSLGSRATFSSRRSCASKGSISLRSNQASSTPVAPSSPEWNSSPRGRRLQRSRPDNGANSRAERFRVLSIGALVGDHSLDHDKVVEILRTALANGMVTTTELDDLEMVAEKSKSITVRSKKMLKLFVDKARSKITQYGPYRMPLGRQVFAANMACDFLKRSGNGFWPHLDRDEVGVGLLLRVAKPSLLNQGQANLCGPAAFLFNLLSDQPGEYARYAIDMYEKGAARIDYLLVKPSSDLRSFRLLPGTTDPIDWITMASLRNSEDWFLHFDSIHGTLSGATTQLEMAWWFNRAGYSDIRQEANFTRHQRDADNMDEASQLWAAGYRVCLLIDDLMLSASEQAQSGSALFMDRHWIVLRSKIDRSGGNVKMKIFTWGEEDYQVPKGGPLPLDRFLENYYGYVAGKP